MIERLSSSSSTNSTATTTTTTHSPNKQKSDFYEPQRFEKEFGHQSEASESHRDENSVEEIIAESVASNDDNLSKSFPIIREGENDQANALNIESASQKSVDGLSGQDSESVSHALPVNVRSTEQQSTSAGDEASSSSFTTNSKLPPSIDSVKREDEGESQQQPEKKSTQDDRTDTEIESLPNDQNNSKYDESEFETDATESLVESSILEMSLNESNLNFSYSTVGMVRFPL